MAGIVNEEYLYDLNVKRNGSNESGVRVYIWDFAEVNVVDETTDVNGNIPQQQLQNAVHSITLTDTVSTADKTPHRIAVLLYGMEIQSRDNVIASQVSDPFFTEDDDYITEAVKATVLGYTGFAINHTSGSITLSAGIWNTARLYDRLQAEAVDNPQFDVAGGIMTTADGINYTLEYDLIVNGIVFDGQSKSIGFVAGKDATFQGVGRADDLSIVGDANWASALSMNSMNVTGTLDFTVAPLTIQIDASTINVVTNSAAPSVVTINPTGGTVITTNTGPNITINTPPNSFKFTMNPSITGYEWRLYYVTAIGSLTGSVEQDGEEVATVDNQTFIYTYSVDQPIAVQIIDPTSTYKESVTYYTLVAADQDVTINLSRETNV